MIKVDNISKTYELDNKDKVIGIKNISFEVKEGEILVTAMTAPDWVPAMKKAKAIVKKDDYKVTVIPDGVSVIVRE